MKRLFSFPSLLLLYIFVLRLSTDMYAVSLPNVARSMVVNYSAAQMTIATWLAGEAFFALGLAPLSARISQRALLLGGGVLFAFTTLICFATTSVVVLNIARFFQGGAVASFIMTEYAFIRELAEEKRALYRLVWIISIAAVAAMLGPLLGGLILLLGSWHFIFGFLFLGGVLVLIPLWILLPERKSPPPSSHYRPILSNRTCFFSSLSFAALYTTLFIWISVSPFLIIDLLHFGPVQYGCGQLVVFAGFLGGAQVIRIVIKRMRLQQIMHLGLFFSFLGVLGLLLWNMYGGKTLQSLILPMSVVAFGFGIASVPLIHMTLTASKENRGTVITLFFILMNGLAALGILVMCLLHQTFLSMIGVLTICVSLACLAAFGAEK